MLRASDRAPAWSVVSIAASMLAGAGRVAISVANRLCGIRNARTGLARSLMPCQDNIVRCSMRLLVAVDFSNSSETVISGIESRPWPAGTEARVLNVLDITSMRGLVHPGTVI